MSLRTTVPMIHCTDCTQTAEGTDYTHTQLKALITHRASSEPVLLPVRSWFDLRALYEPVTFPQAREPIQSQVLRHRISLIFPSNASAEAPNTNKPASTVMDVALLLMLALRTYIGIKTRRIQRVQAAHCNLYRRRFQARITVSTKHVFIVNTEQ